MPHPLIRPLFVCINGLNSDASIFSGPPEKLDDEVNNAPSVTRTKVIAFIVDLTPDSP
jgi:hypothetical protein